MPGGFRYRVLLADNNADSLERVRETLSRENYIVLTAGDGFEALAELQSSLPEIVICDLELPRMSGFEFLAVVRRRFPAIGVIARSEEFFAAGMPEGLLADRFVRKETSSEFELVETIRELLTVIPLRTALPKVETAPAWLPRTSDAYIVITCANCLRSSSVRTYKKEVGLIQAATCPHCEASIHYRLDRTTATTSSEKSLAVQAAESRQNARKAVDYSNESIATSQKAIETARARIVKHQK